jgi:hypothetical protein
VRIGISVALLVFVMAKRTLKISLLALWMALPAQLAFAGVEASFRYPLASFSGPVQSQWAKLAVDPERNEIYTLRPRKHDIRIYDEHGMEIFVFAEGFGGAADIAIGKDGDLFVLTNGYQTSAVHLLNYRGEPVAQIALQHLPDEFSGFVPDRILHRDGSLYLVDSAAMKVVVVDEAGRFEQGYDLSQEIKPFVPRDQVQRELSVNDWRRQQLENIQLNGFAVDARGNLFFTVPVLFSVFKLSASGELERFGKPGGAKGKFGVVAGIAVDDMGYIYVSDRLRSVVLVFDRNLSFQTEFGYRGDQPSNLIVPDELAIDNNGNIYVGQAANRGVSVFKVVHQDALLPRATETVSFEQPEKSGGSIEEIEIDRAEFVVDRGSDVTSTDSGQNTEVVESPNNEEKQNE